jgi:hypothetical protein
LKEIEYSEPMALRGMFEYKQNDERENVDKE